MVGPTGWGTSHRKPKRPGVRVLFNAYLYPFPISVIDVGSGGSLSTCSRILPTGAPPDKLALRLSADN